MKIEIKNLIKEYTQGDQTFRAVNDVSFSISNGDFFCVTGRSGSGKSTLLNIIAGLTLPTSGNVLLDGQEIFALPDEAISLYRNAKIGCVPQQYSLLSDLTVLDNIRLPFYLAKRDGDSEKEAQRLMALVGIEKLAARMPKRLSGGQVKRVAIARAMINKPGILLADEPTGDLDAQTTEDIMKIFKKVADEGTAVIMVTHDLDTTEYANRRFEMNSGILSQK
ncbi:MAG: ABC transporter ATP-binding protein [Treponema sp.]|jgi:putative ABC transport system ATP-binding protein|nr:ABC transporter ATP-binding protein [Treponema sp.]